MGYVLASYIRLSIEDGNEGESDSIKNQRDLIADYIKNDESLANADMIEFSDDGKTGTNFDRPGAKDLLEKVKLGEINCIIVKDFSRFGRNYVELCTYLDRIFPFLGVRFISVNDRYDSDKSMGRTAGMEVGLKTLIHELYSKDISQKVKQGRIAKAKKGEHLCKIAPYGYEKSKTVKNKLFVDEEAAIVVKRIFSMACEGLTPTKIAKALNDDKVLTPLMYRKRNHTDKGRGWKVAGEENYWTRANVKRIIKDERFTGKMVGGTREKLGIGNKKMRKTPQSQWIIVPGAHEAIVSQEEYDKAQLIFKPCAEPPRMEAKGLFAGKIVCGHCSHVFTRQNGQKPYYMCTTGRLVSDSKCKCQRVYEDEMKMLLTVSIENQALLAIDTKKRLADMQTASQTTITALHEKSKGIRAKIESLKALKITLFEQYNDGLISKEIFLSRKKTYSADIDKLSVELSNVDKEILSRQSDMNKSSSLEIFEQYKNITDVNREILVELLDKVIVYGSDKIEIKWNA